MVRRDARLVVFLLVLALCDAQRDNSVSGPHAPSPSGAPVGADGNQGEAGRRGGGFLLTEASEAVPDEELALFAAMVPPAPAPEARTAATTAATPTDAAAKGNAGVREAPSVEDVAVWKRKGLTDGASLSVSLEPDTLREVLGNLTQLKARTRAVGVVEALAAAHACRDACNCLDTFIKLYIFCNAKLLDLFSFEEVTVLKVYCMHVCVLSVRRHAEAGWFEAKVARDHGKG